MIAKTFTGMEEVLASELKSLGANNVQPIKRAVSFEGDTKMLYRVNLWSRAAISILKPVFEFKFQTQEEYYEIMRSFKWDEHFSVKKSFAISTVAIDSVFTNTHFLALRTKDAIADFFRDKTDSRPSVDVSNPDIKFNVYVYKDTCSISLDSSGMPLFKRGYRKKTGLAPLNEVLTAGLIMLSGWDMKKPLYDPMCGSATFSIEAAMMAMNMAPATFRKEFSFTHWQNYDSALWEELRSEAKSQQKKKLPEIFASDIQNSSMVIARNNIMEAGLLGLIKLEKKDFFSSKPSHKEGVLLLNPPYGRRIENENISEFYQKIGTTFKHNYPGFEAWIISPDKNLTHKIGLRPIKKHNVFNGQLDCQYLGYQMYSGSRKEKKQF